MCCESGSEVGMQALLLIRQINLIFPSMAGLVTACTLTLPSSLPSELYIGLEQPKDEFLEGHDY